MLKLKRRNHGVPAQRPLQILASSPPKQSTDLPDWTYDILDLESDFSKYRLLILPDEIRLDDPLANRLNRYLENGGKILATGLSGLKTEAAQFALPFGAEFLGENEFCPSYYIPGFETVNGQTAYVIYQQGYRIRILSGSCFALEQDSYFNRTPEHFSSHQHTPNNPDVSAPGAVLTENTAYLSWKLFQEYAKTGSFHVKELLCRAIDALLGESKTLRTNLPDRGVDETRTAETLRHTVRRIMRALKETEEALHRANPEIEPFIREQVTFLTSQELLDRYPGLSAKERENAAAKEFGTVFIMGIGGKLSNGEPHDGRAPDYDDWTLNGDILIWYPVLNRAIELSSMGIRVDSAALRRQLELAGCTERSSLLYHRMLLNGELPLTIGGGIGQSRLCMVLLQKAHIGEVQASIWDDETTAYLPKPNITKLLRHNTNWRRFSKPSTSPATTISWSWKSCGKWQRKTGLPACSMKNRLKA